MQLARGLPLILCQNCSVSVCRNSIGIKSCSLSLLSLSVRTFPSWLLLLKHLSSLLLVQTGTEVTGAPCAGGEGAAVPGSHIGPQQSRAGQSGCWLGSWCGPIRSSPHPANTVMSPYQVLPRHPGPCGAHEVWCSV